MRYTSTPHYDHNSQLQVGVLLVNLGTPQAPTAAAVRPYLKEFLLDPRVVEIPRPLWWLIMHTIILPLRPRKSAEAYRKIWTDQGSPLLIHSTDISHRLEEQLKSKWQDIIVKVAMRYGSPSIAESLEYMRNHNVKRLIILPIFPQYSSATTGSVFECVTGILKKYRWIPELHFINSYHDHPLYIRACVERIHSHYETHDRSNKLMFSFHGLPKRNVINGDPYYCQCHKTARLIAEQMQLSDDQWMTCFQSRFGKAQWLQPYTDKTLIEMGKRGQQSVDVFCPGFAADCLETLEEIAMQNRDFYLSNGGKSFSYIPALNDSTAHIDALCDIVEKRIYAWEEWNGEAVNGVAARSQQDLLAQQKQKYF